MTEPLPVAFEHAACDFCGSDAAEPLFSGPDRLLGLPGSFTVVRCRQCGLLRQDPRPTADTIGFYYPADYDPYSGAIDDEPTAWRRFDRRYGMDKRRRAIERYCPAGRLLDVGCATGNFLNEMARSGHWQVEGVEPNPEAVAYARRRFGWTIHEGRLADVALAEASFDVVTMWNVLEHLPDPMANLQRVQRLLKPGGLFVFSVPNVESLERALFGPLWLGWELPRHLYYFPRPVMEAIMDAVGLVAVRWDCLVGAYPSFLLSLRFALQGGAGGRRWTRWALALAGALPTRLLLAPAFWLLTRTGKASLITIIARKVD